MPSDPYSELRISGHVAELKQRIAELEAALTRIKELSTVAGGDILARQIDEDYRAMFTQTTGTAGP